MKKVILFVLLCGFIMNTQGYDRKSIVERFTNASCAPCASINNSWYNTTTANLVSNRTISHVIYNGWWPGANDPMYLLNQSDNTARINYYGVNSVPWIDVNGTQVATGTASPLTTAVTNGNAQFSPFMIDIVQQALSDNLIKVKVVITRDSNDATTFTNTKLRVSLTETTVAFASAPGSNGETVFHCVNRKMLPDAAGTAFTIPAPGASTEVELQYIPTTAFLQSVNLDSIRVVAFIQNDNTKYIYQSEMKELTPNFVAEIQALSGDVISENSASVQFETVIRNVGMMEDTYTISVSSDFPAGWTGEYTTTNGTFPFGQTDNLTVSSGDSALISVNLNLNGTDGFGKTFVEYTSTNNPGMSDDVMLRNVTITGIDILAIDASDNDYASATETTLQNVYAGTYGVVSRSALHQGLLDLGGYNIISWTGAGVKPAFYPEEVDNLKHYLDHGGKLFITGQDIGADVFLATGQSQFAQSFYTDYLKAVFVADVSNLFIVKGITGDPISNGIQLIASGTIYNLSLDKIAPFDSTASAAFLYFNGPDIAGIKVATETHGVVYLSFGLEQITDQAIRDTILSRSITWLSDIVTNVGSGDNMVVSNFALDQNYPNPFNPSTVIRYHVPEYSMVTIKVFDVLGKEVANLVNEQKDAGSYVVEFNASNVASGIYFYQMTAGDFTAVKKMSFLK